MDYNTETGQYLQIYYFAAFSLRLSQNLVLQLCLGIHLDLGPIATGSVMVYSVLNLNNTTLCLTPMNCASTLYDQWVKMALSLSLLFHHVLQQIYDEMHRSVPK